MSTISYDGLEIRTTLDLAALNTRTAQGDSMGIEWISEPVVNLVARPLPGGATIRGTVTTTFRQPCGRCGDNASEPLELKIDWVLNAREPGSEEYDDTDIVTFEGDHIDLAPHLEDALLLKLSPFWQPARNPDDSCVFCGKCPASMTRDTSGIKLDRLLKRASSN